MSKSVYILFLFLSLIYCDKIIHTNPNTSVEVVEQCSKLIQEDVRISCIDPLIIKYVDQPKVLIDAIDSKLAEPDIKKQLEGTGDVYHGCTNEGSDANNQRSVRLFNECSDKLLNYRDEVVSAIGKDPSHIVTAVQAEVGRISEKNERAKNIVNNFNNCVAQIYKTLS